MRSDPMFRRLATLALSTAVLAAQTPTPQQGHVLQIVPQDQIARAQGLVVLKGARVLPVGAPAIENGVVVIAGGKIQLVGGADSVLPQGARVVDCAGKVIVPGFVDAATTIGLAQRDLNEGSTEVTPQLRVLDALDPADKGWKRALNAGTTTVHTAPGNRNVVGGLGAVVKTQGATVAQMLLKDRSSLRVTLGAEPSQGNMAIRGGAPDSIYFRRPTTRMGVVWSLRKAFYDAIAWREKRTIPGPDGKAPVLVDNPAFQTLLEAVDKKLPVRTTARAEQDIRTALRMAGEFGYETMLEEPVEAWRVVDLIAQAKCKVLFGAPSLRTSGGARMDGADGRDSTLQALAKAGVPFAITTAGGGDELLREALFAVRAGLPEAQALAAITLVPAQILGVQDRVGSLAAGKDADLVVLSGDPFDPTTKIESVFLNGKEVVK